MNLGLIITAGGSASRYSGAGGLRHKLDEDLGGRPVLQRTVELFVKHEGLTGVLSSIIVAGPAESPDPMAYKEFRERHADRLGLLGAKIVPGGAEHRWQSVLAALEHVPGDCTHIAVHDAARPCASGELIDRVMDLAARFPAVVPGVELSDTIKTGVETDEAANAPDPLAAILGETERSKERLRVVTRTMPREGVFLIQTPQVFEAGLLRAAYENAMTWSKEGMRITDDSALVERLLASETPARHVALARGDVRNIKITRPADLDLARHILGVRAPEGRATHKKF